MASQLPRPYWAADRAMAAHNRQPRDDDKTFEAKIGAGASGVIPER